MKYTIKFILRANDDERYLKSVYAPVSTKVNSSNGGNVPPSPPHAQLLIHHNCSGVLFVP